MLILTTRLVSISLLTLCFLAAVEAQPRASVNGVPLTPMKGSVSGTVSAPGLADASGVKITLRDSGSTASPSQMTGADGSFVFYDIFPGTYSVEIDPTTLPQKYRAATADTIEVKPGTRAETAISLEPRRSLVGHTYIDVNHDGVYTPGKDVPTGGAQVSVGGSFVVSAADGSFKIDDLSAGRMSVIVSWPGSDHTTHVVLDLGSGPVTDRVVNVPLYR